MVRAHNSLLIIRLRVVHITFRICCLTSRIFFFLRQYRELRGSLILFTTNYALMHPPRPHNQSFSVTSRSCFTSLGAKSSWETYMLSSIHHLPHRIIKYFCLTLDILTHRSKLFPSIQIKTMASSTQKIEVSPTDTGKQKINLLLGKLPQEEDWPKTQGEIHSIRERLTNTRISRAMSWNDIFLEYERHMERLVDSGLENDSRFFMIIVIATGTVAIGSAPRLHTTEHNQLKQVIYSGIRRCFRKIGSSGKLDDKLIQRYLGRVRDGTQLLKSLDRNPLYSRVYELPYIGRSP